MDAPVVTKSTADIKVSGMLLIANPTNVTPAGFDGVRLRFNVELHSESASFVHFITVKASGEYLRFNNLVVGTDRTVSRRTAEWLRARAREAVKQEAEKGERGLLEAQKDLYLNLDSGVLTTS